MTSTIDHSPSTHDQLASIAEAAIRATLGGTVEDLTVLVHPDAINREAVTEPPATRGRGPNAFFATGEWLRDAFSDLTWHTEESVVDDDLVVTFGHLSGTHTGPFVVWTGNAEVERVFVPTGQSFTVRQAHFQRIKDDLVVEHWAVRDDQGMAVQAGWLPPTPSFLIRCAIATRRTQRAAAKQAGTSPAGSGN